MREMERGALAEFVADVREIRAPPVDADEKIRPVLPFMENLVANPIIKEDRPRRSDCQ
jgi:hypothetical protein